jgi:hypothetical protein
MGTLSPLHLRRGKVVGYSLIGLGIFFLLVGVVMPYYKTPQRLEGSGPAESFSSDRPYVISSYILPPIDEGEPINLSVMSDRAGTTTVLLAAYDSRAQTISGSVLTNIVFAKDQKGMAIFTTATKSAQYMLVITSYNSSYTFSLTSVWSPFYDLRSFTTYGFLTLPLGLAAAYYDGIVERRDKMFEEALKGIRGQRQPRNHSLHEQSATVSTSAASVNTCSILSVRLRQAFGCIRT